MSKNIKGASPKWRFLEFRGNGDWERKKLGEMAFIVNDKIAIEKLNAETYISTENMLPNFAGVSTASQLPQTGNFTKFKSGDILVSNIRPYLKKVWRSNKTGGASNDVIVFRSNSNIDSNFLEFILKNELFINYVMKNAKGLKMPRGDKESMLIYPVYIPPYPTFSEQQKIADCLSSIDDLISAEEKKLSLLNDYKKGWMQKLFPAEGKTVPEWRFPEFINSGDWEENSLKKVLIKNSMKNKNQKYSLIESISNKFGFVRQDKYFENRRVASKNTSNYYVIKKGYFAYNPSRIDVGSLAYKYDDRTSIISPLYVSFKANNDVIDDIFLWMFFNSISFTKQMIFEGGVRNTLNYENLIQIKIFLPNLPEQQKIAGFLSGIDELISSQKEKIEKLKQHKKALMQGLFPSIEEVCK